jgi:hypothetical protein
MKILSRLSLATILAIVFISCSKSHSNSNSGTSISSEWTFKGVTYKGLITSNDSTTNTGLVTDVLKSSNGTSDDISITFWSHPTSSATFTVNNGTLPKPDPATCTIVLSHAGNFYVSTDKAGDKVDLNISGDTLTASFKNITLIINDTSFVTGTVSGTLIKQ